MPSVISEGELTVPVGARGDPSAEQISRAVDIIMVRLRKARYKFREIAAILNRPKKTIEWRYRRMPDRVKRHYESISLG